MNPEVWSKLLCDDFDKDFILQQITDGVSLFDSSVSPTDCLVNNYFSATSNATQVELEIQKEISEGRYEITNEKPIIVSGLGAIPKSDGSFRLIHDCSRPAGSAANDHAVELPKQKYQSIQDAINAITPGCYLAKVDLKGAYRSLRLNKSQYPFMGLHWKFSGDSNPTFIQEKCMCFGAKAAPSIFHRISQAIRRIMARRGSKIIAYQDDFLAIADTKEQCTETYRDLIKLLRELGFSIAWNKLVDPSQSLIFLGVLFDTCRMSVELPNDKLDKLYNLLLEFHTRTRASRRQLQKLAGKLAYASHVVVEGGRSYLQRIYDTIGTLREPHHKIRLTAGFHADVLFWLQYLKTFNCKRFLQEVKPTIHIFTDACQQGAGIVTPWGWQYLNWSIDMPSLQHAHINIKETVVALLAIYQWAPFIRNCNVLLHSDNKTTESVINKGACHNDFLMHYLRGIFWISKGLNFTLRCLHIPGINNDMADCVSRLHSRGHILHWYSLISQAKPFSPCHLAMLCQQSMSPATLLHLLQAKPWGGL